jgi:hypothetical protein
VVAHSYFTGSVLHVQTCSWHLRRDEIIFSLAAPRRSASKSRHGNLCTRRTDIPSFDPFSCRLWIYPNLGLGCNIEVADKLLGGSMTDSGSAFLTPLPRNNCSIMRSFSIVSLTMP